MSVHPARSNFPRTSITLAGLDLCNPIILASGTCGYVSEMAEVLDLSQVGALVTKSITREPRHGNQPARILDAPTGMFNAIGLANTGIDAFMRERIPEIAQAPTKVIGSIAGNAIGDYVEVAGRFNGIESLAAVELNVSCPNTSDGLIFGESPDKLKGLLREVRPALTDKRMFVKLSPNAPSIVQMAQAAIDGGADALTLINTFTSLSIDVEQRRPRIAHGIAGYSGPGIHPIAVRMVWDVYRVVARDAQIPIIGLGGVMKWQDAAEFILAGASAVGMGTALFVDPRLPIRAARGLEKWVQRQGADSMSELVGQLTGM